MPQYQSHKKVHALKIASVEHLGCDSTTDENEIVLVGFEDTRFADRRFNLRGKPMPVVGGYFVQYEDGYESFSPAKAFEEGYTLLEGAVRAVVIALFCFFTATGFSQEADAQAKKEAAGPPKLSITELQRTQIDAAQAHLGEIVARKQAEATREQMPYNDILNKVVHEVLDSKNPEFYWDANKGWFALKPKQPGATMPPAAQAPATPPPPAAAPPAATPAAVAPPKK
jgi:hypothetical protein